MNHSLDNLTLYYFKPREFTRGGVEWFYKYNVRLLVLIDLLRFMWKKPIDISPHPRACGRMEGGGTHDYTLNKSVLAIDLMPRGIDNISDLNHIIDIMTQLGFTGIGFYPEWRINNIKRPGFHLDVRIKELSDPSMWGGVIYNGRQIITSFDEAVGRFKDIKTI